MRIKRQEFLQRLEAVQPAVAVKAMVTQSNCFVFRDKEVIAFDGEKMACRCKSKLDESFTGAVPAMPLINILSKIEDEEITVEMKKARFIIQGIDKTTKLKMQEEILLPIDTIEKPEEWKALPDNFSDACGLIVECAGKDDKESLICVHFHPKWVEASDRIQMARSMMELGIEESICLLADGVKHVSSLGMTKWSLSNSYVHFKNAAGLTVHCRRQYEQYPNLSPFFKIKGGESITLPKELAKSLERTDVFSSEHADENKVLLKLRRNKIILVGTGLSGEHWERDRNAFKYAGKPIDFVMSPRILAAVCERHNEALIVEGRLMVNGGTFRYCTRLDVAPTIKE